MALKIKVALTTEDGGTIAVDSIVKFQSIVPISGTEWHYNMKVYRDQTQADAGKEINGKINEIPSLGYVYTLQEGDYDSLTPVVVHQKLKAYLESLPGIGASNVEII